MCGRGIVGDDVKATGFGVEGRGGIESEGGPGTNLIVRLRLRYKILKSDAYVNFTYSYKHHTITTITATITTSSLQSNMPVQIQIPV
jgi:hypothetical protein